MDVGVRDLKQNLSQYVHRAERGETIRVTDRGVAIAQLGPLPGIGRLNQGIDEGWVRAPTRPGALRAVERFRSDEDVLTILGEDRGE